MSCLAYQDDAVEHRYTILPYTLSFFVRGSLRSSLTIDLRAMVTTKTFSQDKDRLAMPTGTGNSRTPTIGYKLTTPTSTKVSHYSKIIDRAQAPQNFVLAFGKVVRHERQGLSFLGSVLCTTESAVMVSENMWI